MFAADAISPNLTRGELDAMVYVVGSASADACLDTWVRHSGAMMRIRDARLLSVKLGPDVGDIPSHPLSFDDKEGRVVPWPVVEWILRSLATRYAEECLSDAENCDDEIEDIRFANTDRRGGVRDPSALKMIRELRDISEALRRWVNEPADRPPALQ